MSHRPGDRFRRIGAGGLGGTILPPSLAALSLLLACLFVVAWTPSGPESGPEASDLLQYPWLYLRDGENLEAGEPVVELIAVGDIMLGRGVASEPRPLDTAAPWLRPADLVLGNLECVIAAGGTALPGPYRLRAPVTAVDALRQAGFDVLGLANNHALDFGPAALAETVSRLQGAGLTVIGAAPGGGSSPEPLIREVRGVRLAFLAFSAVPDPGKAGLDPDWAPAGWDRSVATAAVAAARSLADAVVVSVHWGYEYQIRADPSQRAMAQALLAAGADLVVGHHPHVVQGSALGARGPAGTASEGATAFVAYSLGNLVFDQQGTETGQGLAVRAFFDGQGLRAVQALPLRAGTRPRLMDTGEMASLMARLQPTVLEPPPQAMAGTTEVSGGAEVAGSGIRARSGFACDSEVCYPAEAPDATRQGVFQQGAIDLTGDGEPEQVRLEDGQVFVSQSGQDLRVSLPNWKVVDLALGDADNDGRADMLLALWKADGNGQRGCHPFIVGQRGGTYRVLWGGSAVAYAIREVELGDVDGDGAEELIVLEEHGEGTAVAVWRWHGWGFSLAWRGPAGTFEDLHLVPGAEGSRCLISVASDP